MTPVIRYAFGGATIMLGTAIGATTIVAALARFYNIELDSFPETLIGVYENLRGKIFFWKPEWWPTLLSDYILLHISLGFSLLRGYMFNVVISPNSKDEYLSRRGPTLFDKIAIVLLGPYSVISLMARMARSSSNHGFQSIKPGLIVLAVASLTLLFALLLIYWEHLQNLAGY